MNHFWIVVVAIIVVLVVGWYIVGRVDLDVKKTNIVTDVISSSSTSITYGLYSGLMPLQFKIGETKIYKPSDVIPGLVNDVTLAPITIAFINVDDDGRSYTGTVTRAATVSARISVGSQSSTVQFHLWDMAFPSRPSATGKQGGVGNTIAVGPYQVYLISLLPYRKAGEPIDPSRYVATFMIDTIQGYAIKQKAIDLAQAELAKRVPNDALNFYPAHLQLENNNDLDVYQIIFRNFMPSSYFYWMDVAVDSGSVIRFEYTKEPTE
jgi:hypothetical protein